MSLIGTLKQWLQKQTDMHLNTLKIMQPTSNPIKVQKWVDTTVSEMKVFIAMVIGMGLVVQLYTLLCISEYWTTDEVNEAPFFKSALSKDRFWLIISFFHLANNAQMIRHGRP